MSIDRYGINKNDIGPIAKMSFEETEKITLKAALFGEVDPVTGVSANIMTGQPFRGGTAFSQILLDESALQQLAAGLEDDDDEDDAKEDDGDITGLLRDDMQIEDPCSTAQFQMNISMPPTVDGLVEPDIELAVIDEEEFE
jgi:DNA-directed RNA polymerase II subunit RPB1